MVSKHTSHITKTYSSAKAYVNMIGVVYTVYVITFTCTVDLDYETLRQFLTEHIDIRKSLEMLRYVTEKQVSDYANSLKYDVARILLLHHVSLIDLNSSH